MSRQPPELYDPALVFPEEKDQQAEQREMDFKMYEIAKEAGDKNLTLKVTTTDETFIGRVASIDVKDENHLIHFDGCTSADNGQYLSQRQYFTFDILSMEEVNEQPFPETDFNLLPDTSQIDGLEIIPESQEQENLDQHDDQPQDNPISNIPIYQTPEQEYELPIQADGSVDLDFLKLTWKTYDPSVKPFSTWCQEHGIPRQMYKNSLYFKENMTFTELQKQKPSTALQHYNLWASTFALHQKPFNQWFEDKDLPSPLPNLEGPVYNTNIDILNLHLKAYDILDKTPKRDKAKINFLRQKWSSSLFINHTLSFAEWLRKNNANSYIPEMLPQFEDLDTPTLIDLKPYDHLFLQDGHNQQRHIEDSVNFILGNDVKNLFLSEGTEILPDFFLPKQIFGHIFVPNYTYIPYHVQQQLKIPTEAQELLHLQHIIWSRLKIAQADAYEQGQAHWAQYIDENPQLLRTPFAIRFLQQDHREQPAIHTMQLVQHLRAHTYCESRGGPRFLERAEFYDLFIRPLEFLCGQGMPLHSCLMESVNNYGSRCNLLKILLEIAGFSVFDGARIQQHAAYSELTRIRHLSGTALTATTNRAQSPLQRLEGMPRITYIRHTKPVSGAVEPKDFAAGGKFANLKPHAMMPLPDHVLDQFKKLGGRHMPLCDEFSLHTSFLRQYQYYLMSLTSYQPERKMANSPPQTRQTERPPQPKDPTQAKKEVIPPKTVQRRFQVRQDESNSKSWVDLIDMDDPQNQQARPEPMTTSPPPKSPMIPAQRTDSSYTAVDADGVPMLQLSLAQLQALVNPQTPRPTTPAPGTPKQAASSSQQQWEFSQTQSPLENTFFDLEAPIIAKEAAARKKENPTSGPILQPRYHPSIHPRPTWEQTLTPREHDKIFDTTMIWSCTNHYAIPQWAKTPHSAESLYDIVHKTAPMTEQTKARYREMPNYRQFPADGLNAINDIAIYLQTLHRQEDIYIKVSAQPYKQLLKKSQLTGAPEVSEIHFPAYTLSRFMIFFQDVTKERFKPAMTDVQQNDFVLFSKQAEIAGFSISLDVITTEGHNGIERTLRITHSDNRQGIQPQTVRIPWIRMAQTLTTLRQIHEELVNTAFI